MGIAREALKVMLPLGLVAAAAAEGPSEYQVKAAFLLNFARFVEWPRATPEPLGIGVFGADPFGGALDRVVSGKSVNNRVIQIRKSSDLSVLRSCQMIFIPAAETRRFLELSGPLTNLSIVTVGESEGFASQGGIINFVVEDNKVRFEINPQAAARAQIHFSSRLLQLATIVGGGDRKK